MGTKDRGANKVSNNKTLKNLWSTWQFNKGKNLSYLFCFVAIVVDQEKTVTGCASNVCENQGTCLQMKNTFICLCKFGFFGGNCQHGMYKLYLELCQKCPI